jgi:hypothetical protein
MALSNAPRRNLLTAIPAKLEQAGVVIKMIPHATRSSALIQVLDPKHSIHQLDT